MPIEGIRRTNGEKDWEWLHATPDFVVDWSRTRPLTREPKAIISLRVDPNVPGFFRRQDKGNQTRTNAALRA